MSYRPAACGLLVLIAGEIMPLRLLAAEASAIKHESDNAEIRRSIGRGEELVTTHGPSAVALMIPCDGVSAVVDWLPGLVEKTISASVRSRVKFTVDGNEIVTPAGVVSTEIVAIDDKGVTRGGSCHLIGPGTDMEVGLWVDLPVTLRDDTKLRYVVCVRASRDGAVRSFSEDLHDGAEKTECAAKRWLPRQSVIALIQDGDAVPKSGLWAIKGRTQFLRQREQPENVLHTMSFAWSVPLPYRCEGVDGAQLDLLQNDALPVFPEGMQVRARAPGGRHAFELTVDVQGQPITLLNSVWGDIQARFYVQTTLIPSLRLNPLPTSGFEWRSVREYARVGNCPPIAR